MARTRVLWVVDQVDASIGSFGGLLEILRHLDRDAFDVMAVFPAPGDCSRAFEAHGVPVSYRPIVPSGRTLRYLRAVASFGGLLRRRGVDVVYLPDHVRWRPAELLAARWAGVPTVLHVHAQPSETMATDPSVRSARAIIGTSAATLRPLRGALPDAAMHVVYNCIDFERFGPGVDRRGEFFPDDTPIVGFVGVFRPEKGIEYFLDMAAILRRERPDARYLAVGGESPGATQAWLERMRRHAAAGGVADVVHFTGPRTDIPEIMRTLDVLVVPSLCEGFGRVVIEASAVGTPVVGAAVGGIPEAMEDGVTGLLVPPRDPMAIAAAVRRVLDDPAWRARVAAVAPARTRTRFAPAAQVRALERVWRQALVR